MGQCDLRFSSQRLGSEIQDEIVTTALIKKVLGDRIEGVWARGGGRLGDQERRPQPWVSVPSERRVGSIP